MPAAIVEPRHVDAPLNYFNGKDQSYTVDFTQPGAEALGSSIDKDINTCLVNIKDARGIESQFSLSTNGFVYGKHKIDGFEDCKTEEDIQGLVVPETEKLVREV